MINQAKGDKRQLVRDAWKKKVEIMTIGQPHEHSDNMTRSASKRNSIVDTVLLKNSPVSSPKLLDYQGRASDCCCCPFRPRRARSTRLSRIHCRQRRSSHCYRTTRADHYLAHPLLFALGHCGRTLSDSRGVVSCNDNTPKFGGGINLQANGSFQLPRPVADANLQCIFRSRPTDQSMYSCGPLLRKQSVKN